MTLSDALTRKLITSRSFGAFAVWFCAACGKYLVYYLGRYHFTCKCHDDEMSGK